MPSREEAARRRALKNARREAERDELRSSLPLAPDLMRSLFDFVDERLSNVDCDGSLELTVTFLQQRKLPVEPVVNWLRSAGGYCDCEVLSNAEERFLLAVSEHES